VLPSAAVIRAFDRSKILDKSVSKSINSETWDEEQLVARLKKGDEGAFAILVHRFQAKLFGLAYALILDHEESQDIVQEVFLKAYQNIGKFKGQAKLSTWLHRITINQCLNWKRRWSRRRRWQHRSLESDGNESFLEPLTDDSTPEMRYQDKELQQKYWTALQALPEKARTVFVLKELEGLSYDEIATTLRLNRGTVSSRLHYARKYLKQVLQTYQSGE
jgi:RNA polymerase sigma-70 factor (ECF subfamily)